MKLFISRPMRGKEKTEIFAEREKLIAKVREKYPEIEVIDSGLGDLPDNGGNLPLLYLGKSLELLSTADIAIFADGWDFARGCRIEHQCCLDYGIEIF